MLFPQIVSLASSKQLDLYFITLPILALEQGEKFLLLALVPEGVTLPVRERGAEGVTLPVKQ